MRLFLTLLVLSVTSLNYAQITGLSGSAISATSSSLSWTDGGVDPDGPTTFYQIYMGSAVGAQNYANSGQFSAPSSGMTVTGTFPTTPGLTIYARLWHKHGSTWKYTNTTFTSFSGTPPPSTTPAITSPTPSTPTTSTSVLASGFTLTWTPGSATIFWVYVGTSSGASNLYNSGQLPSGTTSIAVPSFTASTGATIFVRLWYKSGSLFKYVQTSYTVSADLLTSYENTTDFSFFTGTVVSPISVPSGTVTEVRVKVDISHGFFSDISVSIESPMGTVLPLIDNCLVFSPTFTSWTFDDGFGATGCASSSGTFGAIGGSLDTTFGGQSAFGTWDLYVTNFYSSSTHTLTYWAIAFNGDTSLGF